MMSSNRQLIQDHEPTPKRTTYGIQSTATGLWLGYDNQWHAERSEVMDFPFMTTAIGHAISVLALSVDAFSVEAL